MNTTEKPIGYTNTLMLSSTTDGIHPHYQTNYVRPVILSGGHTRNYRIVSSVINIKFDTSYVKCVIDLPTPPTYSEFDIL